MNSLNDHEILKSLPFNMKKNPNSVLIMEWVEKQIKISNVFVILSLALCFSQLGLYFWLLADGHTNLDTPLMSVGFVFLFVFFKKRIAKLKVITKKEIDCLINLVS